MQEFLYKPVYIKSLDAEILIFAIENNCQSFVGIDGKVTKENCLIIRYIDINKTLQLGNPIVDSINLINPEVFFKDSEVIDTEEYLPLLMEVSSVLVKEISDLTNVIKSYTQVLTAMRAHASSSGKVNLSNLQDKSALIIQGTNAGLAHIVFKTITGNTALLKPEDIDKVGKTIGEIVNKNANTDKNFSEQENLKKLKDELEYKIIDSLPIQMRAQDVGINMDAVIEEIERIRNGEDDDLTLEE